MQVRENIVIRLHFDRLLANGLIIFAALALLFCACARSRGAETSPVFIIDVHDTVTQSQADFVTTKLAEAAREGASAVILDVDTLGGDLDAATRMSKAIISHDHDYVTVGYVHSKALSSGSLVTLSCKYIAMAPAATLGSAQPHEGYSTGPAGPEIMQWAHHEFQSVAEYRKRNPAIAEAWVTADTAIPGLVAKGDILTLTTTNAPKYGYCDVVAADYPDILAYLHLTGSPIEHRTISWTQSVAIEIANPWVTILLLSIGLALVILEMMTLHSWGIAGLIGGLVVVTVFVAHIIAGTAGWIGLILFLGGIVLLLFETHVFPGHGLSAMAGLILIFAGLFLALGGGAANTGAIYTSLTSIVFTIGIVIAFFIYLPKSRIWSKIGQNMQQKASTGYVTSADFTGYLGSSGVSVTLLRPSGIAEVGGARLNVVSEGAFVQPGSPVEVVAVQGNRVVVREVPRPIDNG
jgi:membrane-bound serine protease (ClpP class)